MKNILLVEDDRNAARAIAARLVSEGHSVCAVHNAWEAIAAARLQNFELFVLDIGLPDDCGLQLATQLLALPGFQATPILFLTGQSTLPLRLDAARLGVCAWLDKPYRPEDLSAAVNDALRGPSQSTGHRFSPLRSLLSGRGGGTEIVQVLIIEDDRRLALALQRRLEHVGYHVVIAHNGTEALTTACATRPDLILSDIYMPGGLGFTLFEHLATRGVTGIPVIFLTASKRPHLRETALQMGAADFFEKPANPAELLRSIRRSLAARG